MKPPRQLAAAAHARTGCKPAVHSACILALKKGFTHREGENKMQLGALAVEEGGWQPSSVSHKLCRTVVGGGGARLKGLWAAVLPQWQGARIKLEGWGGGGIAG